MFGFINCGVKYIPDVNFTYINIAVAGNDKIFDARSANYANVVAPNLVGCTSLLPGFQTAVGGGRRLILPSRCNLNEGTWTGAGYFDILVGTAGGGSGIGAIIQENMAGGFSTTPIAPTPLNSATVANTRSQTGVTNSTGPTFNDPIDMTKGHFLYARSDISVGTGEFPYSLKFDKLYSSGSRSQDGPLGKGWTHSLAVSASAGHDGMQTMGEDSALDAVGTIAEILVALDLMSDPAKPLEKMVISTVGQRWYSDQLIGNTVIVKQGLNGEVFTKLPDGTYNAPPGNNAKLTRNPDGTYSYETANKVILNFNTAGKISTYTHPSGVQVNFSYSGNDLVQVNDNLTLATGVVTINNSGGRITSVSDGSRSVQYAVDGNGNLSSSTDAIGNATTFQYDLPGRMTKLFYPSNPTIAFATNVYDSLGRVQTQTNANGKLYTYYFAGSRSEEIGPLGASRVSYVDGFGRVLKSINPLGKVTTNEYDGQTRLIKTVFPRGNRLIYTYDDAPCAAQNRCTHNIKSIRGVAPNALDTGGRIYQSFTYENNFNQVATITDGLSQILHSPRPAFERYQPRRSVGGSAC